MDHTITMYSIISSLIGGLGLLLIGMSMMTDGLKLASGNALRDILALWTNSRIRGLLSGFLITGLVQSSGAVTVATIGFANAGMLTLERAIWVIYGSNIGTTMTAWIVALIGFNLNIEALALPLIGIGVFFKFTGGHARRGSFGLAILGFGLLFLGIGILKGAFDNIGSEFTLPVAEQLNLLWIVIYVAVGFILTTLMQSSSASIVLALSAAQGGLVPLNAAAAVVIGANLGSTTMALIAIIGATPTAKRVAVGHVSFNIITALVAIILLTPMLWFVGVLEQGLEIRPEPAITLAIFHTLFNVLGVLLMWPISPYMNAFLLRRFTTQEETEARPRHLDKTVLALPFMATDAMSLEVTRINRHTINVLRNSLKLATAPERSFDEHIVVSRLADEVGKYGTALNSNALPPALSGMLANLLESTQQYLLTVDIASDVAQLRDNVTSRLPLVITSDLEKFNTAISRHLDANDFSSLDFNAAQDDSYAEVERSYRTLKNTILSEASRGQMSMEEVDRLLQYSNQAKRACRQIMKATQRLLKVRETLQRDLQGNVIPAPNS